MFGYYNSAASFAQSLYDNFIINQNALTVGIKGKWGSGKTTYLNFLKDNFEKQDESLILVDFKPWLSSNIEQLTLDFFNTLQTAIKDKSISKELRKYTKLITKMELGLISKIFNGFTETSLEQQFIELNDTISVSNKKIIVFIDDLDRLYIDEIMRIIQLIRNTANFHNTIFIVAYDEEYIEKALLDSSIEDPKFYLQKIFTIPHYLPVIPCDKVIKANIQTLKQILQREENEIEAFFEMLNKSLSIRECLQFGNNTRIILDRFSKANWKDFILSEVLLLQYLQMINPEVYNSLYSLKSLDNFGPLIKSEGTLIEINKDEDKFGYLYNNSQLTDEQYKEVRLKPLCKEKNIELCFHILQLLFGNDKLLINKTTPTYSIKNLSVFYLYFEHTISTGLISQDVFNESLKSPSTFKDFLLKCYQDKNHFLLYRLLCTAKIENMKHGLELLRASLVLADSRYDFETKTEDTVKFHFFLFGCEYEGSQDYNKMYSDALMIFFNEPDSQNNLAKKIFMLQYSIMSNIHVPGLNRKRDSVFYELILKNISEYLSTCKTYKNFHSCYWGLLSNLHFENRVRAKNILLEHLKNNIIDFMSFYSVKCIHGSLFSHLFDDYEYSGSSARNSGFSINLFLDFLASVDESDKRNPIYKTYISEFKSEFKITD